jgi:hypothetical protein
MKCCKCKKSINKNESIKHFAYIDWKINPPKKKYNHICIDCDRSLLRQYKHDLYIELAEYDKSEK